MSRGHLTRGHYLVVSPRSFGLSNDGVECVGKVPEKHILQIDFEPEDSIEEFGHVVVACD